MSAVLLLAACSGGSSSRGAGAPPAPTRPPATTTERPRPGAAPSAPALPAGRFAWRAGTHRLQLRTQADLERSDPAAGGRVERERVETVARVTLALSRAAGGALAVSARVDSVVVRGGDRLRDAGATDDALRTALAAPVLLRGAVDPRGTVRLELEPGREARCATAPGEAARAALALARETLPRLPGAPTASAGAALTLGVRWRDTATVAGCAGPIPTVVQTVTRYEALGAERADAPAPLRVRRVSTISVRGQGIAGGQTVAIGGSGTAEGTLSFDPATGRLAESAAEGTLTLDVVLGGRRQRFVQRTRLRATALDD